MQLSHWFKLGDPPPHPFELILLDPDKLRFQLFQQPPFQPLSYLHEFVNIGSPEYSAPLPQAHIITTAPLKPEGPKGDLTTATTWVTD